MLRASTQIIQRVPHSPATLINTCSEIHISTPKLIGSSLNLRPPSPPLPKAPGCSPKGFARRRQGCATRGDRLRIRAAAARSSAIRGCSAFDDGFKRTRADGSGQWLARARLVPRRGSITDPGTGHVRWCARRADRRYLVRRSSFDAAVSDLRKPPVGPRRPRNLFPRSPEADPARRCGNRSQAAN